MPRLTLRVLEMCSSEEFLLNDVELAFPRLGLLLRLRLLLLCVAIVRGKSTPLGSGLI